jgi:hypothetical protein
MASRIGGVSYMLVLRALHEEDFYPYQDQPVQHLEAGDHAKVWISVAGYKHIPNF